ncbi:MAG TPA: class I SAM-dependent methyltransferase [Bacteroidia bacterium]|nr:class I SAM-dependent methyltransferase [Bacteroidia bacterium]
MDINLDKITAYCTQHSESEDDLLKEVARQTHLKTLKPRMLSGHLQGVFLSMISQLIKPIHILEIGTFTGYSALCLAKGLTENGKLITIDNNPETSIIAADFFSKSAYKNKIEFISGNAPQIIPSLPHTFDLVFIDADKKNYALYYDLVFDKLKTGGLIIADNVLWSGKVLDVETNNDKGTLNMQAFNEKVAKDLRVEKIMLPLRDGITLIRKK